MKPVARIVRRSVCKLGVPAWTANVVLGIAVASWVGFPALEAAAQQTGTAEPTNSTEQGPAPAAPQAEHQSEQNTEQKTEPKKKPLPASPKPNAHRAAPRKKSAAPAANGGPRKVVVRQGGTEEPTARIVTGMDPEEATRQRLDAESLLTSTTETMKRIGSRPLGPQQQETVSQINNYMDGARLALKEGDISRAHTLAVKAGLLADDLAKN